MLKYVFLVEMNMNNSQKDFSVFTFEDVGIVVSGRIEREHSPRFFSTLLG